MLRAAARVLLLALPSLLAGCLDPGAGGSVGESTGTADASSSGTGSSGQVTTGASSSTGDPGACAPACGPDQACVDGACEDVGRAEIEAGCHPLGDPDGRAQCIYPWPSNYYTEADAESPTGLRIALSAGLLPTNVDGAAFPIELVNGQQGFTPNAQIRFALAAGVDVAALPPIDDIGRSLADDAPIVLVRASDGTRWPYFAEADANDQEGDPRTIFVRPMRRLDGGERYIVAVRGLRDPSGVELPPSPLFRALRDELSTDLPALEAERARYDEIFATLAAAGAPRGELQLAWDFTTNPDEAIARDFAAIAPQVEARASKGDLGYTITSIQENPGEAVPLVIEGTFTVPSCLAGDAGPGAVFVRTPEGLPDCSGTAEAPFWIGVPAGVYETKATAPMAIYGHGLLGSGADALDIAEQTSGLIVAGTDFWGMSEEDIGTVIEMFGANFAGGAAVGDRLLQSAANFTTLAYLAQGELAADPALQGLLDPSQVYYLGGSQGGIMGGTVTAMADNLERGVLVVGGANYSLMIWRSSAFGQLNDIWKATQPDVHDREILFALFQAVFDRADPLSVRAVTEAAGDKLLLIESIGDAQVPNIASEMMARTYGMKLVEPPVYPVYGLEGAPPMFEGSALLQVDTKKLPLPPIENLPLPDDNGAHGSSTNTAAVQEIIAVFLQKGLVQNACSGACDPD